MLEELAQEPDRLRGPLCDVQKAMQAHPDVADDIANAIRDRAHAHTKVSRVFAKHGINISNGTISRHRANECRNCARDGVVW